MPPPTRAVSRYPPQSELKSVLKALCPLNNFSLQEVLAPSPAPPAPPEPTVCCRVENLPNLPRGGLNRSRWYFGMDSDGYILVTARTSASKRRWPHTAAGETLPVRLHRWLANVPPGHDTLHSCDTPSCIRRAHVTSGTRSVNVADSWRRLRRLPSSPCTSTQPPRAEPPPPLPSHDARVASREAIFVMTGFGSPSKLARILLRKGSAMERESPALQLAFAGA